MPGAIIRAIVRPMALLLPKSLVSSSCLLLCTFLMIAMVTLQISPYRNLWVEDVDLSAFLANSPGDTNAMAAVEEDKPDDKNVDVGDVSEDETEDGLEDGANSANSGSPVMAVLPLVAAVDIIAGGDSGSLTLTLNL